MREIRESGIYWVKDHKTGEWRIGRWDNDQSWWVLAWVGMDDAAYPSGCCSDGRFSSIGPKIEPPPAPEEER